jgi:predicted YcjX-like family ATPase
VVSSKYSTDDALDRSTLGEIQEKVIKKGKRNTVSRLFHAKIDKETIAAWKSDLGKVLLIFNVRSIAMLCSYC